MKKVQIPTCMSPFIVDVNGKRYIYPAGTEQEVPDEVAIIIENHNKGHEAKHAPTVPPFESGLAIQSATVGQTLVVEEVDANGKITKCKGAEYQEKICDSEWVEVAPLTEFTPEYNSTFGAPMAGLNDFEMIAGNKYKVIYDGVDYICEAGNFIVSGINFNAIGNQAMAGGENTGEPFAIGKVLGGSGGFIFSLDMNPHSVQVFSKVVTPIPAQYLPSAYEGYTLDVDMGDNGYEAGSGISKLIHKVSGRVPYELICAIAGLQPVRILLHGNSMTGEAVYCAHYHLLNSTISSVISDWENGKTIELLLSAPHTLYGMINTVEVWFNQSNDN